eukprot:TRINITY_DN104364_c0_g1_i1.p1 TRINITY_DN104364_c0_g1~~TRINITY_DN104364_c0_g1_i1.p1  ORF type:complete len:725 (-),score=99.64 TRINITY_DN104364_c0_g1_i1:26-2200(-)
MLNWGDRDPADQLAAQLKDLLGERTMTFDQLASCYSIKYSQSVTQRLKDMSRDSRPMLLSDFVGHMAEYFELVGKGKVKSKSGIPPTAVPQTTGNSEATDPALLCLSPAVQSDHPPEATTDIAMRYSDVSRNIQAILKEFKQLSVSRLEEMFLSRYGTSVTDVVGMPTVEYLQRKGNIFQHNGDSDAVSLLNPATADAVKDEAFVVQEFEALIESVGPIVYISTLCGKFIQRNGCSVTSIISHRPLELFKRHSEIFLPVGAGNVTLQKYRHLPEVQKLLDKPSSRAQRVAKAAIESQLPVPDVITEQDVVEEFRRLIQSDNAESVYISSLCGRFLQRFKVPVASILDCKPADFCRRYPDIFVMTGGGNVGLREVLGPDAVSVQPQPKKPPYVRIQEALLGNKLCDDDYRKIHASLAERIDAQGIKKRLEPVIRQIQQASFLALDEVVVGGAIGKQIVPATREAELVLFLRQLPFKNFSQWLPHILETLAPVMEYQLAAQRADSFVVGEGHLSFMLRGGGDDVPDLRVSVWLTPLYPSREHLVESIRDTPPSERFYFYAAWVKERNEFVSSQPEETKVLIHLMAWWASKQKWASVTEKPSEWLMELIVVSVLHTQGQRCMERLDMAEAIRHVFEALITFKSLKFNWMDTDVAKYQFQDIWKPLLSHEPLLMDPLNPYCNLADRNCFDTSPMGGFARPPECFLVFNREAAHLKLTADIDDTVDDCQ